MKLKSNALLLAIALMGASFAAPALAQPEQQPPPAQQAAPVTEPAPPPPAAEPAPPPPAAEPAPPAAEPPPAPAATTEPPAKIVFFRPGRLAGAVYTYRVVEVDEDGKVKNEDKRIGRLPNGTFFTHELPAGIYNFNITGPMAVNLAKDRLRIEVEPGETYYVEQTVRTGLMTGGFRLVPSDDASYKKRNLKEADQSKLQDGQPEESKQPTPAQ